MGQWHNFLVGLSGVVAHNGPCGPAAIQDLNKLGALEVSNGITLATNEARITGIVQNLLNNGKSAVYSVSNKFPQLNSKMSQYMTAYFNGSTKLQGELGEEIAELLVRDMNHYDDVLNLKLNNSGHGFDVVAIKYKDANKTIVDEIGIFECKPMDVKTVNGLVELPKTSQGYQMSEQWVNAKATSMTGSTNQQIKDLGTIIDKNLNKIQKYVVTIDKQLDQIAVVKLSNNF